MRIRLAVGCLFLSLPLLFRSSLIAVPRIADAPVMSTAGASPAFPGKGELAPGEVELRVHGTLLAPNRMVLTMEFGRPFEKGVKVFWEPMHTLMLAGMTPEFAASVEGIALRMTANTLGALTFTGEISNAKPRVELRRREGASFLGIYAITGHGDHRVATVPADHDFSFPAVLENGTMKGELHPVN